jgi:inner membrane protein
MNWQWHLLFAFFLCILYAFYFNAINVIEKNLVTFIIFVFISALLPDIDIGTSIIRKIITLAVILIAITIYLLTSSIYLVVGILVFYFILIFFIPRHRGFTHSLLSLAIYSIFSYLFFNDLFIYGIIAYASHLIADLEIKII